jgi:predicted acyl esterase
LANDNFGLIQVQSTWFPLVNRNPQQFMNIYKAAENNFIHATHTVYGNSWATFKEIVASE